MNKAFRPQLWPTLFTIPALITLIALGGWQLQRLAWKENIIAKIETAQNQPAVSLTQLPNQLSEWEFRQIKLHGRYRHDKELHLGARHYRKQLGYHIITPFMLTGGDTILVNRGWVPTDKRNPSSRPETQTTDEQEIAIMLRTPKGRTLFAPDNDPAHNAWFWVDLPEMIKHLNIKRIIGYAEAISQPKSYTGHAELPIPIGGRFYLRNDHLLYAITWFSLAVVLMVVYVLYHRNPIKNNDT